VSDQAIPAAYTAHGFCPICERDVTFSSRSRDFRDHLRCPSCVNNSIPRERALALVLKRLVPDWRQKAIHESSPVARGFSIQLRRECKNYIASQFFPTEPLGQTIKGARNENLENQTFCDEELDVAISLDVFEHVNDPEQAIKETARTLRRGGYCIFTTPTYATQLKTERRARIHPDGVEEVIVGPPEYHGNPVNKKGALVTFHYGYDFPELLYGWSGMPVHVVRSYDPNHGIIGLHTEVYVCHKI
jgi:SAM-dependent methyltransferase